MIANFKEIRFFFLRNSLSALFLLCLFGCYKPEVKKNLDFCTRSEVKCIRENFKIKMLTNRGMVILEIYGKSAPLTAGNFITLASKGFYNGTSVNRVIKKPYPFIVQLGHKPYFDELNETNKIKNDSYINTKSINIKSIPLEIKVKGEELPRYNQIVMKNDDFKRIKLIHQRGSLAMARTQELESAKIQFYIALKNLPELDGRYSVFGKVLEGMEVIDSLKEGDVILNLNKLSN
ncbi:MULTISPECIES: peptidylprolyl isomerase [Prochlorococcus]|uniref:Peptidyl-prolyl cis-trans isomerase n=1 Tax=Prochlorococcus marinus (strain SARG / CCMP1375 / SS120) TaxID=167539 RepID=Q7VB46_PROMA|nr:MULTISPECIES: peptidylprolyl isomerase [Prochlorococcus]AAQ00297.1 Peptidyl-prolyl cis-trans isomerase [Prochlorococcus marinus subsp. marinus str. CCMP1375]KGG14108.1 Peptidyl-prolyl cis-trans isomerase [Prochlorococcus marinus str. LG]KGG20724.1 Peptidyl-prolyl cis-trans isomerase [Prochlorococcus marinus str. SS2]KGG25125.1 Peptidyl-prolyl cis-trans isomerase [Prochlorococcus marinus str. SS35]KGG33323.1 Peptidyl-prolyl cis-trans isomerase [Prochlorococcus marinus str. SS51]